MTAGRAVWGLILIVVGGFFLAANFDLVDWDFVLHLWQLWPLVLVLIGIALLFRDRRQLVGAGVMVVVVVVALVLAWVAWEGEGSGAGGTAVIPIQGPSSAQVREGRVQIQVGATRVRVHAGSQQQVVQGSYHSRLDPKIEQKNANGIYVLRIGQTGRSFARLPFHWKGGDEEVELRLSPTVPWSLELDLGAADGRLDLTDLTLKRLTVDAGASDLDVRVDDVVEGAQVVMKGGAASYTVELPRDLRVSVRLDTELSSKDLDPRFTESGDDTYFHNGGGRSISVELKTGASSLRVGLY